MGAIFVVIFLILQQALLDHSFTDRQHEIQQLASQSPDKPFGDSILPGAGDLRAHLPDAETLFNEFVDKTIQLVVVRKEEP